MESHSMPQVTSTFMYAAPNKTISYTPPTNNHTSTPMPPPDGAHIYNGQSSLHSIHLPTNHHQNGNDALHHLTHQRSQQLQHGASQIHRSTLVAQYPNPSQQQQPSSTHNYPSASSKIDDYPPASLARGYTAPLAMTVTTPPHPLAHRAASMLSGANPIMMTSSSPPRPHTTAGVGASSGLVISQSAAAAGRPPASSTTTAVDPMQYSLYDRATSSAAAPMTQYVTGSPSPPPPSASSMMMSPPQRFLSMSPPQMTSSPPPILSMSPPQMATHTTLVADHHGIPSGSSGHHPGMYPQQQQQQQQLNPLNLTNIPYDFQERPTSQVIVNDYYRPAGGIELAPGDRCGVEPTYDTYAVRTFRGGNDGIRLSPRRSGIRTRGGDDEGDETAFTGSDYEYEYDGDNRRRPTKNNHHRRDDDDDDDNAIRRHHGGHHHHGGGGRDRSKGARDHHHGDYKSGRDNNFGGRDRDDSYGDRDDSYGNDDGGGGKGQRNLNHAKKSGGGDDRRPAGDKGRGRDAPGRDRDGGRDGGRGGHDGGRGGRGGGRGGRGGGRGGRGGESPAKYGSTKKPKAVANVRDRGGYSDDEEDDIHNHPLRNNGGRTNGQRGGDDYGAGGVKKYTSTTTGGPCHEIHIHHYHCPDQTHHHHQTKRMTVNPRGCGVDSYTCDSFVDDDDDDDDDDIIDRDAGYLVRGSSPRKANNRYRGPIAAATGPAGKRDAYLENLQNVYQQAMARGGHTKKR